ncbi:MAG: hypothetical protein IT332_14840 [Ardenticatenales bacterium]|nr:hypothetical protein [Ardenticatenales bacterium]
MACARPADSVRPHATRVALAACVALAAALLRPTTAVAAPPIIAGCPMLPGDNIWNTPVDTLPVHRSSDAWVRAIGSEAKLKADFGSGLWNGGPIGIPYVIVPGDQARVPVAFEYDDESDPGPYPVPRNAPIEGGPNADGDRHILMLDRDRCMLYELYAAHPQPDGSWKAGSGAIFDLSSHALRPDGWTSADAAGLPILPGLVRYDEVASGEIGHAIRFTVPQTQRLYLWPGRHFASRSSDPNLPPMGLRMRLKAGFDVRAYPPELQVILRALKRYGMINADNGSPWFLSGVPDERWDNDVLQRLRQIPGSAFEAVDVSGLMVDPNSGQARQPGGDPTAPLPIAPSPTPTMLSTSTTTPTFSPPSPVPPTSTDDPATPEPTPIAAPPTGAPTPDAAAKSVVYLPVARRDGRVR